MRSEKIDTAAVLRGRPGDANFTNPKLRMEERKRILAYWPTELIVQIQSGIVSPPPWRLLLDPVSWHDVDQNEVHQWVMESLYRRGHWPSLDATRRRFGRVSNHRSGGEVPGQESLI